MDFELESETHQVSLSVRSWVKRHSPIIKAGKPFDSHVWRAFLDLGILAIEEDGGSFVDLVVGLYELAHAGLPGPVLEAAMAIGTENSEVHQALREGKVVTAALGQATRGNSAIGWGAVADLVIDATQSHGNVLCREPLPPMRLSYPLPHGWLALPYDSSERVYEDKSFAHDRQWVLASALMCGLADSAVMGTTEYAKSRAQFGRPIGSFQLVQSRLVEASIHVRGAWLACLDAAWRMAEGRCHADSAAAIAWSCASRSGLIAERNCHQVYGAAGMCLDVGLVDLTWPMWWLRASNPRRNAIKYLRQNRVHLNETPPSNVLSYYSL